MSLPESEKEWGIEFMGWETWNNCYCFWFYVILLKAQIEHTAVGLQGQCEENKTCMLRSLLSIWHTLEKIHFVYSQIFTLCLLVVGNTDIALNKMKKKKNPAWFWCVWAQIGKLFWQEADTKLLSFVSQVVLIVALDSVIVAQNKQIIFR